MISVTRSGNCMGAEISGVDLSLPLSDETFAGIREALPKELQPPMA